MHYLDEGATTAGESGVPQTTFLCVHGNLTWSYLYRHMVPVFLASGARVVAPDLIGFGRSDKPKKESRHSLTWHAQVVMELMAHLALQRLKLVVPPAMAGLDLAQKVTVSASYTWTESEWKLGSGYGQQTAPRFHVVAYDFGVKKNILRMLAERGCKVTVVPAKTPAAEVLKHKPDGIFLSNGPGDPEPCDYAIAAAKELIETGIPTFGICLGHQIMALASGAKTFKMKFGHHGANHPVKDLDSGRVSITSQNHGFAVDEKSLPANLRATHVSLFDGTLQGLARTDKPAFCFQGHPEASPGPHDIAYLFDRFINLMETK